MSNTRKEHFISQFILEKFANNKSQVCVIENQLPFNTFKTNVENIMAKRDLYELRNKDGSFFKQNEIENRFAAIEGNLSNTIIELERIYQKGEKINIQVGVQLLLLALFQSCRLPKFMDNMNEIGDYFLKNRKLSEEDKKVADNFFKLLHLNKQPFEYLDKNNVKFPEDYKNYFIDMFFENKELPIIVFSKYLKTHEFFVLHTTDIPFILTDNPFVFIGDEIDSQIILPFSPNMAIYIRSNGTKIDLDKLITFILTFINNVLSNAVDKSFKKVSLETEVKKEIEDVKIKEFEFIEIESLSENMIDVINRTLCQESIDRIIYVESQQEYVEKLLKEIRGETVE